jgi:hypothetical protein
MAKTLTQLQRVQGLLYGKWLTAEDVRHEIHRLTGVWISGSAASARIRELRTLGWQVDRRCVAREHGSSLHQYSIPKKSLPKIAA